MNIQFLKWIFIVLLYISLSFAENDGLDGSVAEFCAKINDDNTYELYLLKNIRISPNSDWVVPDSVRVGCSNWVYNYLVDVPENEKTDSFFRTGFYSCLGGLDNVYKKTDSLKMELIKGNSCLCYYLKNAKESLKPYYGKKIKGTWLAELYNTDVKLSSDFSAIIVGECSADAKTFEFCVDSRATDGYGLHLVKKGIIEPDSTWTYPDSAICTTHFGKPVWETEFVLDAPFDLSSDNSHNCCGDSFESASYKDTLCRNLQMPKLEINPADRDKLYFHLKNVRESIVPHYWKPFKGLWKTKLKGSSYTYSKSFDAVIVGPCSKDRTIAEYCVDNKNNVLVLEKELDYIPRYIFPSAEACAYCDDGIRRMVATKLDYGKGFVSVEMGVFEKKGDDYLLKKFFYLPQKLKNKKSLYGKILPAKIVLEIQNGEKSYSEFFDFSIQVNGACR